MAERGYGGPLARALARAVLWAAVDVPYALEQRYMPFFLPDGGFTPATPAQLPILARGNPASGAAKSMNGTIADDSQHNAATIAVRMPLSSVKVAVMQSAR